MVARLRHARLADTRRDILASGRYTAPVVDAPAFDYERARGFLRAREARRSRQVDQRFEQAWSDFRVISEMIWREYRPGAIYQWGSLLDREQFSEISDIDIALEGTMNAERYFAMLRRAEQMTRLPLDIVELDRIHPAFARGIRERGRLVYGPN